MKTFYSFQAFLICLICLFTSCNQKNKNIEQITSTPFFDPFELGAFTHNNNLIIEARFSECGEWGGHSEKITIYADSTMNIYAQYKVFPYNCDSLKYYYGNENLKPTLDKTITLNEERKKYIHNYILQLAESKIAERFPGHAGNIFSVIKSDSTLMIQVYDKKEIDMSNYEKLITELFE